MKWNLRFLLQIILPRGAPRLVFYIIAELDEERPRVMEWPMAKAGPYSHSQTYGGVRVCVVQTEILKFDPISGVYKRTNGWEVLTWADKDGKYVFYGAENRAKDVKYKKCK